MYCSSLLSMHFDGLSLSLSPLLVPMISATNTSCTPSPPSWQRDQGSHPPALSRAQREEAMRQAADAAADVRPGATIYPPDLPSLEPTSQVPRLAKQLHPG